MDPNNQNQTVDPTTAVPPQPQSTSGTIVQPSMPAPVSVPQQSPDTTPVSTSDPPSAPPAAENKSMASVVTPKGGGGFPKKILLAVLILLIIGGGAAAYFYYSYYSTKQNTNQGDTTNTPLESVSDIDNVQETTTSVASEQTVEVDTHTDFFYNYSLDYPKTWDLDCTGCDAAPEAEGLAEWTILEAKTADFAENDNGEIVSGAAFVIKARSTENGADSISEVVARDEGYTSSLFNGISGALNLDPSFSTQGFMYTDEKSGFDISLEWRSVSSADIAAQELQTIIDSFEVI